MTIIKALWLILPLAMGAFPAMYLIIEHGVGLDNASQEQIQQRFTVSRQTTYITRPLTSKGLPDFHAAIQHLHEHGVTPTNNSARLFLLAAGPRPDGHVLNDSYYNSLGIATLPNEGDYFSALDTFLEGKLGNAYLDKVSDEYDRRCRTHPWAAKEFPLVNEWLNLNSRAYQLILNATNCQFFFSPDFTAEGQGLTSVRRPLRTKLYDYGKLLVIKAMLLTHEGKRDEALKVLCATHRLARLIAQGGDVSYWLIAVWLDKMALEADLSWLRHFQSEGIEQFQNAKDSLPPFPSITRSVVLCERLLTIESIILTSELGPHYLNRFAGLLAGGDGVNANNVLRDVNIDVALRNCNSQFDHIVAVIQCETGYHRRADLLLFRESIKKRNEELTDQFHVLLARGTKVEKARLIGEAAIGLITPRLFNALDLSDEREQFAQLLAVALLLERYKLAKGRYPDRLNDLIPQFVKKIPDDMYSGKSIIYERETDGYMLHSVGPNGKNDGGKTRYEDRECDDITVNVPGRQAVKK